MGTYYDDCFCEDCTQKREVNASGAVSVGSTITGMGGKVWVNGYEAGLEQAFAIFEDKDELRRHIQAMIGGIVRCLAPKHEKPRPQLTDLSRIGGVWTCDGWGGHYDPCDCPQGTWRQDDGIRE